MTKKIRDKHNLREILQNHKISLVPKFWAKVLLWLHKLSISHTNYRIVYHFPKKEYKKKQFILIGDHATRMIYPYTVSGSPSASLNMVMGFHNFFQKGMFRLLMFIQVIPKRLYETDIHAIKQMLWVVRHGGNLCFFPEGIQSVSGSNMPIYPGTISFLKKAECDVILCKSYGAYLSCPRYRTDATNCIRGYKEIHYEVLFTKEELKEKSEDELYAKLLKRFSYNDYEWNKKAQNRYVFKKGTAENIEGILYHCPKCHKEFGIYGSGNDIVCRYCGNRILLDEYYRLSPYADSVCEFDSIDAWFKYQRKLVRAEVRDSNFTTSYEADLATLHYDKLYDEQEYKIGHGTVTINHRGLRYVGTKEGKDVDILYDIHRIPSFTFTPKKDNDIYCNGEYLLFRPVKNKERVVKYMLYVEELHNLNDTLWDKVSRDAYGEET